MSGLQNGLVGGVSGGSGGAASSLLPGATGTTLVLTGASTALQFISTQIAGSDGFAVTTNGARWHFGTGASDYASSNGTTVTFAGPVSSVGALSGTGLFRTANLNTGILMNSDDPAFFSNGVQAFSISGSSSVFAGAIVFSSFTDDSATPGNRTVNKARGKNSIAIGSATCTITNSFVTAASQVVCCLEFADATATTILSVIPSGTGFTITVNAVATAATKFSWTVHS